jgi:hypothetical protein
MTVALAPSPMFQAFAPNGQFLVGGKLATFIAGTTTPQATYIDSTQTTPNTNPIILNALGQASVWLVQGQTYKLVLTDSANNPMWSVDNVPGGAMFINVIINGVAGVALTVNGANSFFATVINGGGATGQSNGLKIQAGTNASDTPLDVLTLAGAPILTANGFGAVAIGPPTTGGALTVTNAAGQDAIDVNLNQTVGSGFGLTITGAPATGNLRGIDVGNTNAASTGNVVGLFIGNATNNTFDMGKQMPNNTGTQFINGVAGDASFIQSGGNIPILFVVGLGGAATVILNIGTAGMVVNGTLGVTGALGVNGATGPAQVTGWGTPTGPAVVNNYSGTAATLVQTSNAVAEIITALKAFGLFGA